MLDSLLGRAELKARIEELEAEKHHLERRLDAESERRSDAVTARQAAEERINRLEDRIADLEGQVDDEDDAADLAPRGTESLRGDRLDAVLDRLRSVDAGPEGAVTAFVDGDVPPDVAELLGDRTPLVARAGPQIICVDDARLVSVALAPPLAPEPFVAWDDGFHLDDDWFHPSDGLTVALLRSDRFAVGVYDDGDVADVETVETDVKSTHSKGGFSQSRFERRRDEQIATHLEDCLAVLDRRDPDRLVLLGERTVLDDVEREAVARAPVDASGDPVAALDDAVHSFFTTRLTLL
jgi:peptide subunit release factor 1 (eRF1)